MSQTNPLNESAIKTAPNLPLDRPRKSGFVLKPMDRAAALRTLDSLLEDSDEQEQRETFAELTRAVDDSRRLRGERLLFEDYE